MFPPLLPSEDTPPTPVLGEADLIIQILAADSANFRVLNRAISVALVKEQTILSFAVKTLTTVAAQVKQVERMGFAILARARERFIKRQ